ncbi:helix-turn-helix domain-containing protein [Microbispora rosea]|uniref:helix-turn-helix domain-containing protein n=1 Tax=Microbispora rosea TaxID=58117 RepID=UPI0037AD78AC
MLEVAGLSAVEERTYRLLVAAVEADVSHLGDLLGMDVADVEGTLRSMRDKGLVRPVSPEGRRYAPVPPEIALGASLLRQRQSLDRARMFVNQLSAEYRGNIRRFDSRELVELVPTRDAIRERLIYLQDNARDEVVCFCRVGPVVLTAQENDAEPAALARGVSYRVIYERAHLEEPGMQSNVAYGIKLGEQARAVPHLPVRITVVDREVALLPLIQDCGVAEPTAALIRDSTLLDAILALFDAYWARAIPLRVLDDGVLSVEAMPPLDSDDLFLLSLLVTGVPDKSIASQLGISQRTVQRRISHIMEAAGVQTRMQLAWHAAREQWL